ncbi:VanZ family protein [Streptomyces inusitatus]|uniref:VanZ family protein n=1 Tax=Streptomyces inusitatus TaxID=68221 RepID=UPI00167E9D57|nr:VanZ family protein [Streptomyces inusitatus]
MLTAVFRDHGEFVALALVLTLLAGALAHRAARARGDRPVVTALWVACTTAVLSLTLWTTGGATDLRCVIDRDVLEPFRHLEGRLNAAMFVPFGFLGVLATRRVALMACLALVLPVSIETVQVLTSPLTGGCDPSDLVANTFGAICGVGLGVVVNRMRRRPCAPTPRYALAACGVAFVLLGASWAAWVNVTVWDRTMTLASASPAQKAAVGEALRRSFGDRYPITGVDFTNGEAGTGTVTAHFAAGSAELSWPDLEHFTVNLIPRRVEEGHAFPVPGASGPVRTHKEAERVALAYAERFAPWGLRRSVMDVERLGEESSPGWLVSWRHRDGDLPTPTRLDVLVDSEGHISDLITRRAGE